MALLYVIFSSPTILVSDWVPSLTILISDWFSCLRLMISDSVSFGLSWYPNCSLRTVILYMTWGSLDYWIRRGQQLFLELNIRTHTYIIIKLNIILNIISIFSQYFIVFYNFSYISILIYYIDIVYLWYLGGFILCQLFLFVLFMLLMMSEMLVYYSIFHVFHDAVSLIYCMLLLLFSVLRYV